jgi:type IV secretion system protein VirD4
MSPSYGTKNQKTGQDLSSKDEIAVMDRSKCIAIVSGVRPFLSKKYDITKHKRYKELSDYDERNTFDVEAFLSTKLKMKKTDTVETYDLGTINQ